jgi:hypothetical protein
LHGFRSFFYETLRKVRKSDEKTPAIPIELCHALLGDQTINPNAPQEASYNKKTDKAFNERELLEAYLLAVPDLTIGDEARERALKERAQDELKDTKTLEVELQKVKQDKSQEFQDLRQEVQQLRQMIITISKSGATISVNDNGEEREQVVEGVKTEYYDASNTNLTRQNIWEAIKGNQLPIVSKTRYKLTPKDEVKTRKAKKEKQMEQVANSLNKPKENVRQIWMRMPKTDNEPEYMTTFE